MTDYKRGDAYKAGLWDFRHIEAFVADGNSVNSDELEKLREQIAVLEASNRIKQENLDRLQSIIDEANSQEPVGFGLKDYIGRKWDGDTFINKLDAEGFDTDALQPLYAKPIPAQPIQDGLKVEYPKRRHITEEEAREIIMAYTKSGAYNFNDWLVNAYGRALLAKLSSR